jgi:hypothetical protein
MNTKRLLLCALLYFASAATQAATTFYADNTSFNLTLAGVATALQDFESFAYMAPLGRRKRA